MTTLRLLSLKLYPCISCKDSGWKRGYIHQESVLYVIHVMRIVLIGVPWDSVNDFLNVLCLGQISWVALGATSDWPDKRQQGVSWLDCSAITSRIQKWFQSKKEQSIRYPSQIAYKCQAGLWNYATFQGNCGYQQEFGIKACYLLWSGYESRQY